MNVLTKDKEFRMMEELFLKNKKNKCTLLVVKKTKSFDKFFDGDFDLKNNLINRKDKNKLNYIYTGLQIINPKIFSSSNVEAFSINRIWDSLMQKNELFGMESNINFFHISTLDVYKSLLKKNFKH